MATEAQEKRKTGQQQKDIQYLLHGYTDLSAHQDNGPVVIVRGQGIRVFDQKGKDYIEAASGMWCTAFGFDHEELIEAAVQQLRTLPYYHTLASRSVNPAIDLAEQLAHLVPIKDAHIHFAVSGSEANDFLIKFLYYYNNARGLPDKKKVISRHNSYHGCTMVATSLSGLSANHRAFDLPLPGFLHTANPHYYRHHADGESEDQFSTRMAAELEALILQEGPDTIMAFMAEPISGGGGVIIPRAGYYEKIQAVLNRYGVLFLADEIITGFGRTGEMFGCQTMNIQADAMTLAKGLSGAYQPISAIAMSDEIFNGLVAGSDQFGHYFAHGATYSGHPVGAAVGLKVLELFKRDHVIEHINRVAVTFARRMDRIAGHPLVGEARYQGLIGAVELARDKQHRLRFEPEGKVAGYLKARSEAHGVIVRSVACSEAVAFSPPLIITEAEIEELFDRFELALQETWDWVEAGQK